jgi:glycogen debranching enzyme
MEDSMSSAIGTPGLDDLLAQEWLATNQIGGYACGTAAGLNTRKYHGLLVASMATPVRRMVLLSRVEENLIIDGAVYPLASSEYPGDHPSRRLYAPARLQQRAASAVGLSERALHAGKKPAHGAR